MFNDRNASKRLFKSRFVYMTPPDDRGHHNAMELDAVQVNGDGSYEVAEYLGPKIEEVRSRLNQVLLKVLPSELSHLLKCERNKYDYLFFKDDTLDQMMGLQTASNEGAPEVTELTYAILNVVRNDIIQFIQEVFDKDARVEREFSKKLGCMGLPLQFIETIKKYLLKLMGLPSDIGTTKFDAYFEEGSFLNEHLKKLISERFRREAAHQKAEFIVKNVGLDSTYGNGFLTCASLEGKKAILAELNEWPEEGERYSIFIDLDHFGPLNKVWDSNMGDLALRHVAKICRHFASKFEHHVLIRYGGEEMGIVVHASKEEACILAEKIRIALQDIPLYAINEINEQGRVDDKVLPISISGNRYENILTDAPGLIDNFGSNGFYLNQEAMSEKMNASRGKRSLIPDPDHPDRKILLSKMPTTGSLGVAQWPMSLNHPEDIMKARTTAEVQHQLSKEAGRNQTHCDNEKYELPSDYQFSGTSHIRIAPDTSDQLRQKFESATYITSEGFSNSQNQ